jgi:peroxiredoxin
MRVICRQVVTILTERASRMPYFAADKMDSSKSWSRARMTTRDRAPDFAIGRADGKIISLRDFSGYPLVLWFGGTRADAFQSDQLAWCTQLMAGVSDGGGELLAIEVDGAWCELKFRHKSVRVGLAAGLPADGPVARAYGVEGYEAIFVIDPGGMIQWRHVSPPDARPPIAAMLTALTRTAAEPGPHPPTSPLHATIPDQASAIRSRNSPASR